MIIRRRERDRSVRVGMVCRSMAMLWSPLRLRSGIAIRWRMGAPIRHCVLGRVWLPSVFISRLRAIVATTPVVVATSTAA